MSVKRVSIIGTAPSWAKTPWGDPSMEYWSLNDAYMCRDAKGGGLQRIDRWYELHPLDHMFFRPKDNKVVYAHDVPKGHYVRPEGHIEWLKTQAATIPVYLQNEPPDDWPANARRFPLEELESRFGTYWASGPSYMVAQALAEGFQEIHIYGIHLSTEAEYRDQRANFEHLLGIARGMGVKVHMAEESPLLKHPWKYGYEPKPVAVVPPLLAEARAEIKTVRTERAALAGALIRMPRWKSRAAELARLEWLDLVESDLAQTIARCHTDTMEIRIMQASA